MRCTQNSSVVGGKNSHVPLDYGKRARDEDLDLLSSMEEDMGYRHAAGAQAEEGPT